MSPSTCVFARFFLYAGVKNLDVGRGWAMVPAFAKPDTTGGGALNPGMTDDWKNT